MLKRKFSRGPAELSGEVFGVRIELVASDPDMLERMAEWLPPNWRKDGDGTNRVSLRVLRNDQDQYDVFRDDDLEATGDGDDAIRAFEWLLRAHIAHLAPDHLFFHAGVAAYNGKAIVVPGPSFSGKTTLVAALVRAGAVYYSDEYAVMDAQGLVHPYPKPLAIRSPTGGGDRTLHHASSFGGTVGIDPVPIGVLASAQYRSGASWEPLELTPGQAALELLVNAFSPEERARKALAVFQSALVGVAAFKGDRGDADATAGALLARLNA